MLMILFLAVVKFHRQLLLSIVSQYYRISFQYFFHMSSKFRLFFYNVVILIKPVTSIKCNPKWEKKSYNSIIILPKTVVEKLFNELIIIIFTIAEFLHDSCKK